MAMLLSVSVVCAFICAIVGFFLFDILGCYARVLPWICFTKYAVLFTKYGTLFTKPYTRVAKYMPILDRHVIFFAKSAILFAGLHLVNPKSRAGFDVTI